MMTYASSSAMRTWWRHAGGRAAQEAGHRERTGNLPAASERRQCAFIAAEPGARSSFQKYFSDGEASRGSLV